jgi:hypothetical protein
MDGGGVRALIRVVDTSAVVEGRVKRRDREIVREKC